MPIKEIDHLSVSRVAAHLGVAWHTANNAIINEGQRLLFNDPARFDGVTVLGVDERGTDRKSVV